MRDVCIYIYIERERMLGLTEQEKKNKMRRGNCGFGGLYITVSAGWHV